MRLSCGSTDLSGQHPALPGVGAGLSHCHIFSHKGGFPPPPLAELISHGRVAPPKRKGGLRKAGPSSPVGHSWLGATHPQLSTHSIPAGLTQHRSAPTCSPTTAQHLGLCRCLGFSWDRASPLPSSRYRAVFGIWDENNADNTPMFWCC